MYDLLQSFADYEPLKTPDSRLLWRYEALMYKCLPVLPVNNSRFKFIAHQMKIRKTKYRIVSQLCPLVLKPRNML